MRIVHLAAGAAGMYCGSCMHDNRLAAALRDHGRDVLLFPLYTPLRTDEADVSEHSIFYGGLNVYLQQASAVFRHTPRVLDRLLNTPALLNLAGRFAGSTSPQALGDMTLSVLRGEEGRQYKELDKLIDGLRPRRPDLVHLPNLMFAGAASRLKRSLGTKVVCALAGEDVFVDELPEPARGQVLELIRRHAAEIDAFVAVTEYYARHAIEHFGLPAERVHTIPMGISTADFTQRADPPRRPFTIGYLAHVCPAKGLAELSRALVRLRRQGRDCRVRAAGYLGPADKAYLEGIRSELAAAGVADRFEYVGEVDRAGKLDFLRSLHVLSVPTAYRESKGFYVLEALAAGVPVVQPQHGSFPELIAATRGGLLYEAGNVDALAEALGGLMDNNPLRSQLAAQGHAAVHRDFTVEKMAAAAWALYERVVGANPRDKERANAES